MTSAANTRSKAKKTLLNVEYVEAAEFPPGKLPTKKDVIHYMIYLLRPKRAGQEQRSKEDAAQLLAELIQEHWIFCNVYTKSLVTIKKHIQKLYQDFINLLQTRKGRRNASFENKASYFNKTVETIFDIFCEEETQRKHLEKEYNVKMTETEWEFLNDQRCKRKMFCEDFIDKKWLKTIQRRNKDRGNLRATTDTNDPYIAVTDPIPNPEDSSDSTISEQSEDDSAQFQSDDQATTEQRKRRKIDVRCITTPDDELPIPYQHIRESFRKVRPEIYETIDKLKSVYHMSERQAEASIVVVGNKLFGRKWKFHNDSECIDLDTLPQKRNIRQAGKSIEAMVLCEIAHEIMDCEENVTISYCSDGSKKQGTGSFSVQGITINKKYRALPVLSIATETRSNLANLKQNILSILAAASGVAAKDLFEKIDFVMTDQTAHNFGVEEDVATSLHTDHEPDHLFCNVHPSLMFNRVLIKQWEELENAIGKDKIYSTFLVNATTTSSTVTEQALDCITRLINHDFDHKPWNKAHEFDIHINPKLNKSVSLKDERFNRVTLTCAITLYHLEDVNSFLLKYENVTNQLACIVRCFLELDFMKVMYCVGALVGLHLIEPFLSLTASSTTCYSKLTPSFQQLYEDLISTDPSSLLNVKVPAFKFVSQERFDHCKYDPDICECVDKISELYQGQITILLSGLLPRLADGFKKQKGEIFGFGGTDIPNSKYSLSNMDQEKLENAPINNLNAERSVGFINYELSRRGAKELQSASSAHVKSSSSDLIDKTSPGSFRKFQDIVKKGGRIPEIMKDWNNKQNELKQKGMEDKEILNITVDKRKFRDLTVLKLQNGPFVSSDEVDSFYLNESIPEKNKIDRLYLEIRYARDTSLSLPKSSVLFRLMKNHKRLPLATYVMNLKVYLDKIVSKTEATFQDFNEAIRNLYSL